MKNLLSYQGVVVDTDSFTVTYNGKLLDLRPKEYSILLLLLSYPNQVFTYTDIVESLWSVDTIPTESSIRSHIKALRKAFRKVGATETIIETVHGVGYRFKVSYKKKDLTPQLVAVSVPLFHNFLQSKSIEYLAIANDFTIKFISQNLLKYCDYPEELKTDVTVFEPFPEFIGLEETFEKIRVQEMSHFSVQGIARTLNPEELKYLNFYIVSQSDHSGESPEKRLLYIFFEDASEHMVYKQRAIQQEHEVNLGSDHSKFS